MSQPISEMVAREAIAWLVELQGVDDEETRCRWLRWREASAEHERAWQRIEQVNLRMRSLSPAATRSVIEELPAPGRRRVLKALGGLAVGLPLAWFGPGQARPLLADFRSAVGERREVSLADGSVLQLNTDSAVNVRLDGGLRVLELVRGEVGLRIARQASGFLIRTEQGTLLSEHALIGLRQYANCVDLYVLEGDVVLRCRNSDVQRVISGGQAVRFDANGPGETTALDPSRLAWRSGMLVARNMRLGDFVAELSRYRGGWLSCAPGVAGLMVSGTFPLDDTDAVLAMLEVALPLKVQRRTRFWVRLENKLA